eukprot:maker-scaffold_15-snap-gene-5.58-mRNA-1 protein AED:0.01 eAED:0.01 QI:99/1/1/1/1/1/2/760/424
MLKNVSTELTPAEVGDRPIVTHSAGLIGASHAVKSTNWKCPKCKAQNSAKKERCIRCKAIRPNLRKLQNFTQSQMNPTHAWREAFDKNSNQIYYYNLQTKETTWTRPKEMGPAVYNTGWFGRGRAGFNGKEFLEKQNEDFLKRPAPKQSENLAKREIAYKEGGHEYNIWFNRYTTENHDDNLEPADARCKLQLHAGYTLADSRPDKTFFCLWFARGKCAKGSQCKNYHRIPTYEDVKYLENNMLFDCFGRERHASQRDDMAGVGSFNDPSRTLYVGRLLRSKYLADPGELRKVIERHFSEFGEIESVNVVWRISIAFVRFRFRSHCEFAKVAMERQSLDNDEVLLIRWAYEDPNPVAKESVDRANADAVVTAMRGKNPGSLRLERTGFKVPEGTGLKVKPDSKRTIGPQWYPDTSSQYKKKQKR